MKATCPHAKRQTKHQEALGSKLSNGTPSMESPSSVLAPPFRCFCSRCFCTHVPSPHFSGLAAVTLGGCRCGCDLLPGRTKSAGHGGERFRHCLTSREDSMAAAAIGGCASPNDTAASALESWESPGRL